MKNENVFSVKNLVCSYNGEIDVLKIKDLKINKGINVLLGESGSGKSTFLETLGLMNRTLKVNKSIYNELIFRNNGYEIDFAKLIIEDDQDALAKIRRKYFSFIFQDTNLMPNFSAYENISITQMIEGISLDSAINKAREIANDLHLKINEQKKTFELSGGEKQRAAFIRAISPSFLVLFGDEPTGNLDDKTSKRLMKMLTENIKLNNRTAIIVSHNIDLAIDFADQVIVLKKVMMTEDQGYGEIQEDYVFTCDQTGEERIWLDNKANDVTKNIKDIIRTILKHSDKI